MMLPFESSFSVMADILQAKTSNMNVETYESYEVVKYNLKAMHESAISLYSRPSKESPVNIPLASFKPKVQGTNKEESRGQEAPISCTLHLWEEKCQGFSAAKARKEFRKRRLEILKKMART